MVASFHAIVAAARLKHTPTIARVGNRPDLAAEPDITATGSRRRTGIPLWRSIARVGSRA
jgi:hypothetical protein